MRRPVLTQWEYTYWDAYLELSGSRQMTAVGPAEIPYPYKLLWLDENRIWDEDDRYEYLVRIKAIDIAYLNHLAKKAEN